MPPRGARAGPGRPPSPGRPSRRRPDARRRRPSARARTRCCPDGEEQQHVDREHPLPDRITGAGRSGRRDGRRRNRRCRRRRPSTDSRRTAGSSRPELLHRPDAHEVPRTRAGERAHERDEQDRTKRGVDLGTPDQVHQSSNHDSDASEPFSGGRAGDRAMTSVGGASATTGSLTTGSWAPALRRGSRRRYGWRHGDRRRDILAPCPSRSKSPRRAARISLLWLCSFTRPRSPSTRRLLHALPEHPCSSASERRNPPRTSVGTTVRKR